MSKVVLLVPESTFEGTYDWLKGIEHPIRWAYGMPYEHLVDDFWDESEFEDAHIAVFVRNPYNRAFLFWRKLRARRHFDIDLCEYATKYSFLRFLEKVNLKEHLRPMSNYINELVNHTIAMESFDEDCKLLPFEAKPLPKKPTSDWKKAYHNRKYLGKKMINDWYADDFRIFGYEMSKGG